MIPQEILCLTDIELGRELTQLGDVPGPITTATRRVYQLRLLKLRENPDLCTPSQQCGKRWLFFVLPEKLALHNHQLSVICFPHSFSLSLTCRFVSNYTRNFQFEFSSYIQRHVVAHRFEP